MTSSKHPKTRGKSPFADDLERNPRIGQSKGLFSTGESIDEIAGDSTVEGDVENDSTLVGGAGEHPRRRTNK